MHSTIEFLFYLMVLGMIMSIGVVMILIGILWENKYKILLALFAVICLYLYNKKRKSEVCDNNSEKQREGGENLLEKGYKILIRYFNCLSR